MREIKFRGQTGTTEGKKWVYGYYFKDFNGKSYIINTLQEIQNANTSNVWIEVLEETVEQYTGLKDKNGKEIYEGDIVKVRKWSNFETEVVKFDKGCFYAGMHYGSSTRTTLKLIQPKLTEVIGNIYENPELLEE